MSYDYNIKYSQNIKFKITLYLWVSPTPTNFFEKKLDKKLY